LLQEILLAVHKEGHEGVQRTLHRLRRDFHFPHMKRVVQDFVRACAVCQRNKPEQLHPAGLLLPLPVPQGVWTDIAMDFVEALPRVKGKSVILTVVDRFSKYAHFLPLAHPYSAETVTQAFFTDIVRLHGIPQSIVSDRDPVFTSNFWRELLRLSGTKLQMSSAFHPQSDGQSESANKVIVMYLRCLTGDRPRDWLRWLPWAEYVFNTAFQSSLRETPFRVVYGRDPPSLRSYEQGATRVPAVAQSLAERAEFIDDIRHRLEQAQAVQKRAYDRSHRPVVFLVGDWVLLRLRHRPVASLPQSSKGKLKPRFYGPYRVVELINDVAVRLALPPQARLHDVFHVGLLKKFHGDPRRSRQRCPKSVTALSVLSPSAQSRRAWHEACARSSFSGKERHQHRRHGRILTHSELPILYFSSRTSCLSRRGEMSCTGACTRVAAGRATSVAQQNALSAWVSRETG
jgi:transposase InsO family protein